MCLPLLVRAARVLAVQVAALRTRLRFFSKVDDYFSAALFCKASFLGHAIDFLMNCLVAVILVCHNAAYESQLAHRAGLSPRIWPKVFLMKVRMMLRRLPPLNALKAFE